jgi:hypothetical protein
MAKSKTKAERHHMSKVAATGCIACRKIGFEDTPAELHHIRNGQGMSQRASNYEVIPLCPTHHRHGKNSIHLGKLSFEAEFGTERELLAEVHNEIGYKTIIG